MSASLIHFITAYGYWAIFWLIFLQEIGVPNPVSNEFVLLFSGSLAFTGLLSFPFIFLTAVFADVLGAAVLYVVFYFFGSAIVRHKPKWLPISEKNIEQLKKPLSKYGMGGIFLGRMLPFARGYAAVAAGLLNIKPVKFAMAVVASALVWSGGFVTLGAIFGKYWIRVANTAGGIEKVFLAAILLTVLLFIIRYAVAKYRSRKK